MNRQTCLLTCTQETPNSNLCRDVGSPDRSFMVFLGPSMEILVKYLKLPHDHAVIRSVQFIVGNVSFDAMKPKLLSTWLRKPWINIRAMKLISYACRFRVTVKLELTIDAGCFFAVIFHNEPRPSFTTDHVQFVPDASWFAIHDRPVSPHYTL